MALSKEQFLELRGKGLTVDQIVRFESGEQPTEVQTKGNQFEQKPAGFLGKARDFVSSIVGGGKLAEGAGMALAAPEVTSTISEEQRQTEGLQNKILEKIREKKTRGEDVSQLEKALKQSQGMITVLQDVHKDFEEALPTSKEVIGSSLRLAGTLGAGLITRTAAKGFALGKATTVMGGALRGAGAGVVAGGVEGAVQGAGIGLGANEESSEVVMSALKGAGIGAIAGGVVGGIAGGVQGGLQGKAIQRENFVKDFVSPKQTAKIKTEAIRQGRLGDPGFFKKADIQASKRDITLARSVDDVVFPKATVGENVDAIRLKISQTNGGVKNFITDNKVPFNTNQIRSRLDAGNEDLRLIFASDTSAQKTYKAVVDEFMKQLQKKDTLGLFEARQSFDQVPAIKKLLQTEGLGENTKKEIVLSVRRAANEYIADQLPKGNVYRELLKQESYMLEALGNISEKTASIIGKNRLQILTQQYPILKWIVGGIATGIVGAAGIGVGSSIIGSSE